MEETKDNTENTETLPEPKKVEYCDLCHFPKEYCEYSHAMVLKKVGDVKEEKEEKKEEEKEGAAKEGDEKEKEKEKDKKHKKKKEGTNTVIIEQTKRGKKKHTTYITNLEKFGYVLKDISKMFSKKFACSCTVTKEDNGTECVTLTGEFADEVYDYILDNLTNIKAENIMVKKK